MQGDVSAPASLALEHLRTMTGPFGLYQHATKRVPLLSEGHCVDDTARAVQVLVSWGASLAPARRQDIERLLGVYWRFITAAEEKPGIFFNFRDAQGQWLPHGRSEDMYARLVRMCATLLRYDWDAVRRHEAAEMMARLFSMVRSFTSLRGWAEVLVALAEVPAGENESTVAARQELIVQGSTFLTWSWQENSGEDWPWFEPIMTYSNALLPHGLLRAAAQSVDTQIRTTLHASTAFLIATTVPHHQFIPVGSRGWYPRGQQPSRDNQQPIEAGTMIDFLLDYHGAFPDRLTLPTLLAPYLWFFGQNTNNVVLADVAAGASLDGLFLDGVNQNCGAESMLAYLWAEVRMAAAPAAVREVAWRQRDTLLAQAR